MKAIKALLVLFALMVLAGCNIPPKEPPQWRNIFVKPSASLTKDCPVSPPPNKAAYMKMSPDERLQTSNAYNVVLLKDIGNCNLQWAAYRKWQEEAEKTHTKDNPK